MKQELRYSLKSFLFELFIYAVLVTVYYLLVLHFLGDGLKQLYQHQRHLYAGVALFLIIAQGLLLEILTRVLLAWIKPHAED